MRIESSDIHHDYARNSVGGMSERSVYDVLTELESKIEELQKRIAELKQPPTPEDSDGR